MSALKIPFYMCACLLLIVGCAKKDEPQEFSASSQEMLNQAVNTQTELTLMQDDSKPKAGKISSSKESKASPASVQNIPSTPTVEDIQRALKNTNLYSGKIDGEIGPKTTKAVKTFQEQNDLAADGKVGQKTWAKLQVYLNQTAETLSSDSEE